MGGGGWDTALQKICELHEWLSRTFPMVIFNCNLFKMLPNRLLALIYTLLEVFSQLATCQLAPGPFEEHPCTRGCQTGHRSKPRGKQTKEEWTVKQSSIVSLWMDLSIGGGKWICLMNASKLLALVKSGHIYFAQVCHK